MMKSKTFDHKKSHPLKQSSIPSRETTTAAGNFSPIDFPTSPQLLYGEEIIHQSHPQHPLSKINLADPFNCSGCKEDGSGRRYSCNLCDFQLHEFCALARPALMGHPFHYQHGLSFNLKPAKTGIAKSKCDACGKTVEGYSFQCNACSFQMHPCCAMLPGELTFSSHPHSLKLLPAYSQVGDSAFICGECKKRRSGRVYRCTNCDYHLHAFCAKRIANGLPVKGTKGRKKKGVLGLAIRVVIGFVGSLIEGIGEGFGEALIQNIPKGRSCSGNSRDE